MKDWCSLHTHNTAGWDMVLYLIGYNNDFCFVTPEPLGPGGDPYPAQNSITDPEVLDKLVHDTVTYFRSREDYLLE